MYAYNKCVTYILITDDGDVESVKDITDNTDTKTNNTTNKDHAAKLVDEKRKHLERRLSAAQRDALLLNEAKEDRAERKEFREMLKASNESFITALNNMSESMRAIGQCIARATTSYHNASPDHNHFTDCNQITTFLNYHRHSSIFLHSSYPPQVILLNSSQQTLPFIIERHMIRSNLYILVAYGCSVAVCIICLF